MRKSKSLFFVTLLVYLFLIGPLVVIMAASFSDTTYLKFPGEGFTLRWYHQILQVKSFGSAAKNSIIIAFAGTFVLSVQRKGADQKPVFVAGADSGDRVGLCDAAVCGEPVQASGYAQPFDRPYDFIDSLCHAGGDFQSGKF